MGSSSKQVTGYRYFANFLLFIGNPIEKVLGINFDKRGWQTPLIDEKKNPLSIGEVKLPNLYGENEGGVAGRIHARYGTENPDPVDFYSSYLAKNDLPPLAYPYQSYLAFTGLGTPDFGGGWMGSIVGAAHGYYNNAFYLGNSGYMKEMLLWPKRTRIRNDGRRQWYEVRDDGAVVCEIGKTYISSGSIKKSFVDYDGVVEIEKFTKSNDLAEKQINFNIDISASDIFLHFQAPHGLQGSLSAAGNLRSTRVLVKKNQYMKGLMRVTVEYTFFGGNTTMYFDGNILSVLSDVSENYISGRDRRTIVYLVDVTDSDIIASCKSTEAKQISGTTIYSLEASIYLVFEKYEEDWYLNGESPDINPIHKIREILTDDTAMNKPESDVNDINFMKAADRIWGEGLGISWSITEKSCLEAINELCGHIESGVRVNRQTGLYEMVLFRDDWFEESEIHTLSVNKIKRMSLEVANADEAINQLNVSYYNRDAIKDSSFSIAENASIRNLNGRVNAEDADFPYFMNQRNAAVVAQWKLKQMSSPVWKGSFTTAEYNARKWNRYDLLKLAWPRKWQGTITVRIMKINLGAGTDVSIDFVEVVPYSSELSSNVVIDTPIDVAPRPPLACQYEPFEMPYYLAVMALGQRQVDEELSYENNFGLVGVVAEQPQANSLYAVMMTHDGTEGEEWLRAATINYELVADLDQIISKTSTSFTVKDSTAIAGLPIGTLVKCGSDWIGTPGEWMVFQGVDPYTGVVSVKRGALDTLPQAWGINAKLYFCGNDVAYDSSEYVAGEEVLVSALTTTPSGVLEQGGSIPVEMKARAIRPYPPANVKFNDVYFPESLLITNNIVLTWAHRNRVQQTGGEIIGWYEGDVTVEDGVTYSYELVSNNTVLASASSITTNTATIDASVLIPNKPHTLKLWSVRDGYESHQKFEHSFFVESASLILTATATKSNVIGNTVPTASISVNVDESLKANMKFDGSSISGKAPAGSTITIEVED